MAHKLRRSQRALKRVSSMDAESGTGDACDDEPVEGPDCLTRCKQIQLLVFKYVFVCMNMASIAISAYMLFIANNAPSLWIPTNSLLILGLIFGMILSVIAIRGGMKEELYLVLTYSVIIAIVFCLCILKSLLTDVYSAGISCVYVAVCFYYSLLLHLKPTKVVLPPDLIGEQMSLAAKVLRHSVSRKVDSSFTSHSSQSSVRGKSSPRLMREPSSQSSPCRLSQTHRQSAIRKKQVHEERELLSSQTTRAVTPLSG